MVEPSVTLNSAVLMNVYGCFIFPTLISETGAHTQTGEIDMHIRRIGATVVS